ncbi:MAG: hypothetical protein MZV70_51995 [Desulfobacterales bacterium]|nr:hypothetical protein [Desulfobacterales bacterium]
MLGLDPAKNPAGSRVRSIVGRTVRPREHRRRLRRLRAFRRRPQPLPGPAKRNHLRYPGLPFLRPEDRCDGTGLRPGERTDVPAAGVPGVRGMIGALATKQPLSQAEAIRLATEKSVRARNLYTEQTVAELTAMLAAAEEEVRRAILRYKSLGSLPDNKLAALEGLEKLQTDIQETTSRLHQGADAAFPEDGQDILPPRRLPRHRRVRRGAAPFYRDLTPEGIDKLATRVFTLVDTDALDFMTNYNLVLAGDVNRELADGIKRVVMGGIATGKGVRGHRPRPRARGERPGILPLRRFQGVHQGPVPHGGDRPHGGPARP